MIFNTRICSQLTLLTVSGGLQGILSRAEPQRRRERFFGGEPDKPENPGIPENPEELEEADQELEDDEYCDEEEDWDDRGEPFYGYTGDKNYATSNFNFKDYQ